MKSIDKESLLASLEHQVNRHIQAAVEGFQPMGESSLRKRSPTGGWSITQCLDHLNSYGHYYLPYLKKGLDKQGGKPTTNTFQQSWLGTYLIRLMDPATGRKKFKAIKRHQPTDVLSDHHVVAEFINQQEELLLYLRQARQTDLNAIRIPLSVATWIHLSLGDILQFMVAHTERHVAQAKRNL